MKIQLDEDVPHALRLHLPQYEAYTVQYLGWSGLRDVDVVRRAEAEKFQLLITPDQGIAKEQNWTGREIGLLTLMSQDWPVLQRHLTLIAEAIEQVKPGTTQQLFFPPLE